MRRRELCGIRPCRILLAAITLVLSVACAAAGPVPGAEWARAASPEVAGWSSDKLRAAREYSQRLDTAAVVLVAGGQVVDEWGRVSERFNIHSMRKSILTALIGMAVDEGKMKLEVTLVDLGIDDNEPSLTEVEKQATVHDLLKARSGVYHPALYETAGMAAMRPARGSHAPGTFWYYNNWDFNALGTIYEKQAAIGIFEAFRTRLAGPLQMQDFRPQDGEYFKGRDSVHPAYPFRMTARDLARFGLLYLREGDWGGKQLVPAAWVRESVKPFSEAGFAGGYGYMWWTAVRGRHLPGVALPEGSYSAQGAGGHYVLVIPAYDVVIVHRVNTDIRGNQVNARQFGELVRLILDARLPAK
ncbi:serine hydrolase [Ramlibacter sp. WS9]|uniref:serine hydrolase domain-containing protein n=1 Tax=Ramlibacter sp. WS9 TaxID=1882741 RepID=UPI0011438388|nr:serine hydrolase [Ramlibacter sp. WS9]ROZ64172.1 class C beta-lactamase-related serine hydrolase [Ramlibacter sp. WS9]